MNAKKYYDSLQVSYLFTWDDLLQLYFALSQRVDQLYWRAETHGGIALLNSWDREAFRLSCELYAELDLVLHTQADTAFKLPVEVIYAEAE